MPRRRAQSSARWVFAAALLIAVMVSGVLVVLRAASPLVVVSEAVEGPVVQAFYSTGTLQPLREFPIKSNVAGTIAEVPVDKGTSVKKHDVVAVVSDPEMTYLVDKARAEVTEKEKRADSRQSPVLQEYDARIAAGSSMLDIAQREESRVRGLIERNAASQQDLDASIDRVKTNWSNVEAYKATRAAKMLEVEREVEVARSALAIANFNFQQQTLASPVEGVVLDRPLSIGTRVAVNDRIMNIADVRPEQLVMRAAVDEEDITKVRRGQTVRMTLYSFEGRTFEGAVSKMYDQADLERRTFEVEVKLAQPDPRMQPGMSGELAFIMDAKDKAIVIPSQAVQKGAIYCVRDGRLVRLDAQIGLRGIERTELVSGANPGERIVISAVADLQDGQRVRTTYTDPVTAAGMNKPKVVTDSFKGFR